MFGSDTFFWLSIFDLWLVESTGVEPIAVMESLLELLMIQPAAAHMA